MLVQSYPKLFVKLSPPPPSVELFRDANYSGPARATATAASLCPSGQFAPTARCIETCVCCLVCSLSSPSPSSPICSGERTMKARLALETAAPPPTISGPGPPAQPLTTASTCGTRDLIGQLSSSPAVTASAAPVILPWSPCPALGGSPACPAHAQLLHRPAAAILSSLVQSVCDLNAAGVSRVLSLQPRLLSDLVQRDVASPVLLLPAGITQQLTRSVPVLALAPNAPLQAVHLAALKLLPRLVPGHQPSSANVDLNIVVNWFLTCSPGLALGSYPAQPHLRASCHQQHAGAPASPHQVVHRHRLAALQLPPVQVVLPHAVPEDLCLASPPAPAPLQQHNQVARPPAVQRPHAAAQALPLPARTVAQPYLPLLPAAPPRRLPSTPGRPASTQGSTLTSHVSAVLVLAPSSPRPSACPRSSPPRPASGATWSPSGRRGLSSYLGYLY